MDDAPDGLHQELRFQISFGRYQKRVLVGQPIRIRDVITGDVDDLGALEGRLTRLLGVDVRIETAVDE